MGLLGINIKNKYMAKYRCTVCGYIYDEAAGDHKNNIMAGTKFSDLPEAWVCPECGVPKSLFEEVK